MPTHDKTTAELVQAIGEELAAQAGLRVSSFRVMRRRKRLQPEGHTWQFLGYDRITIRHDADRWPAGRLAAVIAHELGHVRQRHPLRTALWWLATIAFFAVVPTGFGLATLLPRREALLLASALVVYGGILLAGFQVVMGRLQRPLEFEADRFAVTLVPVEDVIDLLEDIALCERPVLGRWARACRTHPSAAERIAHLRTVGTFDVRHVSDQPARSVA